MDSAQTTMETLQGEIDSLKKENERLKMYLMDIFGYASVGALAMHDTTWETVCDVIADILKKDGLIGEDFDSRKAAEAQIGELSDGYHTFNELYEHRTALFALIANTQPYCEHAWKSRKHADGSGYDGYFICGIDLPRIGQTITYHVNDKYWSFFKNVKTLENAPKWDGHTPSDVVNRLFVESTLSRNTAVKSDENSKTVYSK